MSKDTRHILFLALLAAVLFSVNITGYDLWPPDEPRFAQVAREMMQSGDYLAPHVNGQPYKEKPPLLFWAIAAASFPSGDVTPFSARLPSALAGIVTVVCTYLLASRLFNARTALWSCLMLLTNVRFFWQGRVGQIDMLLTACLAVALLAFWRWHEEPRTQWLVVFYAAIVAAVYAKGPAGLIFTYLMAITFYWKRSDERRGLHLAWGLVGVVILIGLWLIPARMSVAAEVDTTASNAIASNLFRQTIGRFLLGVSHAQSPLYYVINLPLDWLPWALFLPWIIPWVYAHRKDGPQMRLLLSWTVPAFVFFSICIGKRALYMLPLFPALSILFAASILDLADSVHARWRKRTGYVWAGLLFLIGAGPCALPLTEYRHAWTPGLLVFSVCAFALSGYVFERAWRTDARRLHVVIATSSVLLAILCSMFIYPLVNHFKSAKPLCEPVRRLARAGLDFELHSVGFSREEFVFYSEHFHEYVPADTGLLDDVAELDPEQREEVCDRMQDAIIDATRDTPIEVLENPSAREALSVRAACYAAIEQVDVDPDVKRRYKQELPHAMSGFFSRFDSTKPVFFFVRESDWRWLLAAQPEARNGNVINHQSVGSRHIYLVANDAGAVLAKDA